MRILKKPEDRKNEILDTAEKLFTSKGYSKTTILDILEEIGIAKGTFYYYFKSKEEVMDAIITRIVDADVARARAIASNPNIHVLDKFFQILLTQKSEGEESKDKIIKQFHQPSNAEMHQKSLVQTILQLTPVLTEVVQQGIKEKVFHTEFPYETVEFLLVSGQIIFDEGYFRWEDEDAKQKAKAFISIMEATLGAEKGSCDFMKEILPN